MLTELRNRIYNYAQEPRDVHLTRKPTQQHEQTNKTHRQFFGLTQVCRQLRSEYLPMYMAQTKVHIQCVDSLLYINTFILPTGTDPKQARGDLTVQLPGQLYESRSELSTQRDIIHVVNLCGSAPQVNVAFALGDIPLSQSRFSGRRIGRILHDLTKPEAMPELHDFIRDSVEHLECWMYTEETSSLRFRTKKGHAEKWMDAWSHCCANCPTGQESGRRMERWRGEMRLDGSMHHLNDYVHVVFIVDEEWKACLSHGC